MLNFPSRFSFSHLSEIAPITVSTGSALTQASPAVSSSRLSLRRWVSSGSVASGAGPFSSDVLRCCGAGWGNFFPGASSAGVPSSLVVPLSSCSRGLGGGLPYLVSNICGCSGVLSSYQGCFYFIIILSLFLFPSVTVFRRSGGLRKVSR